MNRGSCSGSPTPRPLRSSCTSLHMRGAIAAMAAVPGARGRPSFCRGTSSSSCRLKSWDATATQHSAPSWRSRPAGRQSPWASSSGHPNGLLSTELQCCWPASPTVCRQGSAAVLQICTSTATAAGCYLREGPALLLYHSPHGPSCHVIHIRTKAAGIAAGVTCCCCSSAKGAAACQAHLQRQSCWCCS